MSSRRTSRKGQGLSLEVIVVAALVILILVILMLVFSGRISIFGTSLKSCASQGGVCATAAQGCTNNGVTRAVLEGPASGKSIGCPNPGSTDTASYYCCSTLTSEGTTAPATS